jgi:hypothetical protein
VPDLLEVLEGVSTCAGGISDDPRSEPATDSDLGSQIHIRLTAVVPMPPQFVHAEPKTGMPLDGARQAFCRGFDRCTAITGVQHQRFHVPVESDRPMDLCLDVVVQEIRVRHLGKFEK